MFSILAFYAISIAAFASIAQAHTYFNGNLTFPDNGSGTASTYIHSDEWLWQVNFTKVKEDIQGLYIVDGSSEATPNITLIKFSPPVSAGSYNGSFIDTAVPGAAAWGGSVDDMGLKACDKPFILLATTASGGNVSTTLEWKKSTNHPTASCKDLVLGNVYKAPAPAPASKPPSRALPVFNNRAVVPWCVYLLATWLVYYN